MCNTPFIQLVKVVISLNIFQQHLPNMCFQPKVGEMEINEMFALIKIQNLCIVGWTIIEEK
jgi:hypothetical protein